MFFKTSRSLNIQFLKRFWRFLWFWWLNKFLIARSALSVRGHQIICCPFVRSLVSPLVRPENNWFLRGGYGGCFTAPGQWWFEHLILKDPKVDRSLMKLTACIGRFRDHFSDPHFGTFWQQIKKVDPWFRTGSMPWYWLTRASFSNWRVWRARHVPQSELGSTRTKSVASRPCRARCI